MSDEALLALLQPILDRVRTDVSAVKEKGTGMWRSDDALTRARLLRHLAGAQVRGAYLIKPGESVCRCAVLDLDDHTRSLNWDDMAHIAARIIKAAAKEGLRATPWSSSSGHGIHLWFLWDEPQDARSVRVALEGVLTSCMLKSGAHRVGLSGDYVEIYPKQDHVPADGYGNQVWLPLGGVSRPLEPDMVDGTLRPVPLEWLVNVWDVGGWDWAISDAVPELPAVVREAHVPVVLDESAFDERVSELRGMLASVRDYSYDTWLKIGFALHEGVGGRDEGLWLWDEWSSNGPEYEVGACAAKWDSMGKGGEGRNTVGLGTLRHLAMAAGWAPVVEFEDISVPVVEGAALRTSAVTIDQPPYQRNQSGQVMATTENIVTALTWAGWQGPVVGWDEFRCEIMVRSGDGWRSFEDEDYTDIKILLENRGKFFLPVSRVELRECVFKAAKLNSFDSAKLWLERLEWDGVRRVDRFLCDYWGAVDSEYSTAVGRYLWSALAARVLVPGIKADMVPILVGAQGAGKTRGIEALVPSDEYMCEISFDEKDDDVARKLRGVLVAEIAELRGLGTRDEEGIKAFITRRHEQWVPKFKEYKETFFRRVVFFGTTNDTEFLADITGNRRWLPFNVGARAGRSDSDVRPDLIERDRAQLWAEARELFGTEGVLWQDAERLAVDEHGAFMGHHPWEDAVAAWLVDYAEVLADKTDEGLFVTGPQILTQALNITNRFTAGDGRQLAKVMTKLGFHKTKRMNGSIRGWLRSN